MNPVSRHVLLAALLCPALAFAGDLPQFSSGGFLFNIQYGAGIWLFDKAGLESQIGPGYTAAFMSEAQNTHSFALRAGYNIKGHATIAADFSGTGWNVTNPNRGGAGFLVGSVGWHPLELVWLKKEQRPIPLDVSTWFGVGYGIGGSVRGGMDGLIFQWGLDANWFFTRYLGAGIFLRDTFLSWGNFYVDYDNRALPGMTIPLPKTSGGAFLQLGVTLVMRVGD